MAMSDSFFSAFGFGLISDIQFSTADYPKKNKRTDGNCSYIYKAKDRKTHI
eukprot:Pgem_evm1s15537